MQETTQVNAQVTPEVQATPETTVQEPINPIASNVSALDDYDVWTPQNYVQKNLTELSGSKPERLDEALVGKPLEEQVKIINDYNTPEVQRPKQLPPSEDGASLLEQWYKTTQEVAAERAKQAIEEAQKTEKANAINSSLDSLESELQKSKLEKEAEEKAAADKAFKDDPKNWEEMTPEQWDQHRDSIDAMEKKIQTNEETILELRKDTSTKNAEIDILNATIENLKDHIKEMSGKTKYYESSSEILQGSDEVQLINLRRLAEKEPTGHAWLNYLYHLSNERQKLTGKDLSWNINEIYNDTIGAQTKAYLQDYEKSKTQEKAKDEEADQRMREYAL